MRRQILIGLIAAAVLHASVSADRGRGQVPSATAAGGTAAISGQVTKAQGGGPARQATVSVESLDGLVRRSVTADDRGNFIIAGLAPGHYSLNASAAGLVTTAWRKDAASRGPTYVSLAANEHQGNVRISLARGGVITGRVVDRDGVPVEGVPVHALISEYRSGHEVLRQTAARPRITDDRGYFRLFGLEPGEYFVAAVPGALGDQAGGPLPDHVLTYFPGVPSAADAQAVTVAADRESAVGDLMVGPIATAVLSGVVLGATGTPRTGVELVLSPASGPIATVLPRATSNSTGAFSFTNVPPGSYLLQNLPLSATPSEFGVALLNVPAGATNTVLRLQAASTARGRVDFEDDPPDFPARQLMLGFQAASRTYSPIARGARVKTLDDWTLEFTNIWGPQYLRLLEPPAGWMIRHVYAGAEDFVNRAIDFTRDDVQSIRVVLTRRGATVAGVVRDDNGVVAAGARVLIYPADAQRWTLDERATHWTRVDSDGRYRSRPLPAGNYLIVAVDDLSVRDWPPRPALLESLRGAASAISVSEGSSTSKDLSLTGVPR
jgi:hypothetical protein